MLPAGPLSMTPSGEMLSSRQPFSASPSDSTRELVPVTAKIAMRKSGPITTPVSLTSRNGKSASLAEDAVSGRRCVGLNSGSASLRISGAAGSISAGGKRDPGKGRWLVMEPSSIRISPAQTTDPTRIKAGKRIIYFNTEAKVGSKHVVRPATVALSCTECTRPPKGRSRSGSRTTLKSSSAAALCPTRTELGTS